MGRDIPKTGSERNPRGLFDLLTRTDAGPAGYAESFFPYMNRSARDDITRIRAVLESWFQRYPKDGREALRSAFRSDDDWQHQGAFFELLLHEVLVRLDCRVTVHPPIPGTTRRPDFLAALAQD